MNKSLSLITGICLFLVSAFAATDSLAQNGVKPATKTIDVKGKKATQSRGANPNIKSDMPTTDKAQPASRGGVCGIYFDNYTGLHVRVYVDGNFKGVLSPYGESTVAVGSGYTTIYCVSTGGTTEWTSTGGCDKGEIYRYKLSYATSD